MSISSCKFTHSQSTKNLPTYSYFGPSFGLINNRIKGTPINQVETTLTYYQNEPKINSEKNDNSSLDVLALTCDPCRDTKQIIHHHVTQ